MRIHCLDRQYSIDGPAFESFLIEQGFTDLERARLVVHVRPTGPAAKDGKKRVLGEFKEPFTLYIYTYSLSASVTNNTLLHELRHYWKSLEHQRRYAGYLAEYERMRKGAAKQHFYYTRIFMGWQTPLELDIPYEDRPCEIDARAFAEEHSQRLFVALRPVVDLYLPLDLYQSLVEPLSAWVKRGGGVLKFVKGEPVLSRLAHEDIGRLARFLKKYGFDLTWSEETGLGRCLRKETA